MNRLDLLNQFWQGLGELLEAVELVLAEPQRDPYTAPNPDRRPHEHDTRVLFVDELLRYLGWRLGPRGDVREEARLQATTTKFMDYVGIVDEAGEPLLLVEAKAWGKPPIAAREAGRYANDVELVMAAVQHNRDGKPPEDSPAAGDWDAYLRQVGGYVKTLKTRYGHTLPRAAIVSGEWLVIFKNPVATFVGNLAADDIAIFSRDQFYDKAEAIFDLLHRSMLTQNPPVPLRPAQLPRFVELDDVAGIFHGVHVVYERTGTSYFGRRPRIQVYPALFVARKDDAVFTVVERGDPIELDYAREEDGHYTLAPHLAELRARGADLLASCGGELGGDLAAVDLAAFPGLPPQRGMAKALVKLTTANEWLVATGSAAHFLLAEPRVQDCRFHTWADCGDDAIADMAASVRSVHPRVFFVDTERHHCANQVVQDRRADRCLIKAIDTRTCCQACVFLEQCWTPGERATLPCGQ